MPSLHVALPAAAAFWYGLRSWFGRIALVYSAVLGLVVVYGGDHYLADVIAGYAVAGAALLFARWSRLPVFATDQVRAGDSTRPQELRRAA
jgi:membrane-associated phospholipid phosphatase